MKYKVHMGKSTNSFHSLRRFDTREDALSFMWAMANVKYPEKCWIWQGLDGWFLNTHMKGKPYPENLKPKIMEFISEDEITTLED
jgi:hypothetical protein